MSYRRRGRGAGSPTAPAAAAGWLERTETWAVLGLSLLGVLAFSAHLLLGATPWNVSVVTGITSSAMQRSVEAAPAPAGTQTLLESSIQALSAVQAILHGTKWFGEAVVEFPTGWVNIIDNVVYGKVQEALAKAGCESPGRERHDRGRILPREWGTPSDSHWECPAQAALRCPVSLASEWVFIGVVFGGILMTACPSDKMHTDRKGGQVTVAVQLDASREKIATLKVAVGRRHAYSYKTNISSLRQTLRRTRLAVGS